MKKKIIISVFLIAFVLSAFVLTIPKVSARSEITEGGYNIFNEILLYNDDVLTSLLSLESNNENDYLRCNYYTNSVSTLWNYNNSLEPFNLEVAVDKIVVDTYHISLPDFERGYWLDFKGVGLRYSFVANGIYQKDYYIEIPIYPQQLYDWYDGEELYLERLFIYSGYDKWNVENGIFPTFNNVQIEQIEDSRLEVVPYLNLVYDYDSNLCLKLSLDITYPTYADTIYVLIPLYALLPSDFDYSIYVDNVVSDTYIPAVCPIYTPMTYFTFKNYESLNGYDEGYDTGYLEGKREGYIQGQNSLNISFTDWIGTAVGGFLDFEIVPGLSLLSILSFIISLGLLFLILRFFSGG